MPVTCGASGSPMISPRRKHPARDKPSRASHHLLGFCPGQGQAGEQAIAHGQDRSSSLANACVTAGTPRSRTCLPDAAGDRHLPPARIRFMTRSQMRHRRNRRRGLSVWVSARGPFGTRISKRL